MSTHSTAKFLNKNLVQFNNLAFTFQLNCSLLTIFVMQIRLLANYCVYL